jgi:hypothetical protein
MIDSEQDFVLLSGEPPTESFFCSWLAWGFEGTDEAQAISSSNLRRESGERSPRVPHLFGFLRHL